MILAADLLAGISADSFEVLGDSGVRTGRTPAAGAFASSGRCSSLLRSRDRSHDRPQAETHALGATQQRRHAAESAGPDYSFRAARVLGRTPLCHERSTPSEVDHTARPGYKRQRFARA